MFKLLTIRMNYAKEKLNKLIEKYGVTNKKVLKQSKKLDRLIIKYHQYRKVKINNMKVVI